MNRSREDGLIAAVYVNRATQVGIDRETALLNIIGSLSQVTTPDQFATAMQLAYIEIERKQSDAY
jgi:hypothetical protein